MQVSRDIFGVVKAEIISHSSLDIDVCSIHEGSWLVEFGFDSVNSVDLIMSLEESFDIEIDDQDAVTVQTVQDIVAIIESCIQAHASSH